MCLYDMNHQQPPFCDNVSPQPTQNSNSDFDYLVSLLVKHKLQKLSSRTSDPERAMKFLVNYIGLQSYHQTLICRIGFMEQMLRRRLFTHEVQVLALKIVQTHLEI